MQIGLPAILFIVFLVLKLTGVIAWSWWWVSAPLWVPLAIALVIWTVTLVSAWAILRFSERRRMKRRQKAG